MPLAAGDRLGPYEIAEPIGKGGRGEVYRARDTRLGRDVGIKVSTGKFSERFAGEARAIAALNHPNICTLFDVGPDYLVMELVEGPTLGRSPRGRARTEDHSPRFQTRQREDQTRRPGEGARFRAGQGVGRRADGKPFLVEQIPG